MLAQRKETKILLIGIFILVLIFSQSLAKSEKSNSGGQKERTAERKQVAKHFIRI